MPEALAVSIVPPAALTNMPRLVSITRLAVAVVLQRAAVERDVIVEAALRSSE